MPAPAPVPVPVPAAMPALPKLLYRCIHPRAHPPRRMSDHAAGLDLAACLDDPVEIAPGARVAIPTGLQVAVPAGTEGQVRPRSGLALRHGISIPNAPGTIDADYRGELKVILVNLGNEAITIAHGDRIAQLVVAPVVMVEPEPADELPRSSRGAGGFGSTGV